VYKVVGRAEKALPGKNIVSAVTKARCSAPIATIQRRITRSLRRTSRATTAAITA
jgi:pheromone shutdown protein TraB